MTPLVEAHPQFVTTRWTVVLAAADKNSPDARAALETLCRTYWYPLYAFVRRSGKSPHDAQDLTQAFFAKILLEKELYADADRERGRFRTFLITALRRFMVNEWEASRAAKRGGDVTFIALDSEVAETRYSAESPAIEADSAFEADWSLALLERVLTRLRAAYAEAGRETDFEILKPCLTAARGEVDYADVARRLGVAHGAARVAVHRVRERFRSFFREAVADTLANRDEVDAEMRHIVAAVDRL